MDPTELTVAEVGAALRMSKPSAQRRVELALRVYARLPATLAAMGRGEISMAKLRVIDEATEELSAEHAAAVEARVLDRAPEQTSAGLGASVRRAVIGCDPAAAERRRQRAVRDRTVAFYSGADGMAALYLRAPAAAVLAAYRQLCDLAESACTPDDQRTAAARRADTLIDLILHSTSHQSPAAPTAPPPPPAGWPTRAAPAGRPAPAALAPAMASRRSERAHRTSGGGHGHGGEPHAHYAPGSGRAHRCGGEPTGPSSSGGAASRAGRPGAGPRRHLPVAGLPAAGGPLRVGPHRAVPGRVDRRAQS